MFAVLNCELTKRNVTNMERFKTAENKDRLIFANWYFKLVL